MEDQDRQRLATVEQALSSITARLNALAEGHLELPGEGFRVGSTRLLEKLVSGAYHLHQRDGAGVESDLTGAKSIWGKPIHSTAPTGGYVLVYNASTGEIEWTLSSTPAAHVLATTAALGPAHTVSGLTARQVLRALSATTAAFGAIQDADLPATIARDSELHNVLTIGADAAHSLATQVLSAVAAGAAQVGHISKAAQTLGSGVKTFSSIPVLPASNPTADNEAARKLYVDLHILKSLLTTRGDMIRRGASAPERFAKGTAGKLLKMGANDPDWAWDVGAIEYVIDGGGSAITTGVKGGIEVPYDCFVTGWTVVATDGNTGAIVVDVWKDTYANFPPTVGDTIAGTEKPTITATGNKGQDLSLSSWTQALTKGDWLFFNVDSITTLERVTLSLRVDKYRAS